MNKIFKVVWSKTKECYVVVSEVAKNNGGKKKVLASVLAGLAMVGAAAQMGTPVQAGANNGGNAVNLWADKKLDGSNNSANTVGANSVAVGNNLVAGDPTGATNGRTGGTAIAIGVESKAKDDRNIAIGYNNTTEGQDSFAMGSNVIAGTGQSIAIGSTNVDATTGVATQTIARGKVTMKNGRPEPAAAIAIGAGAQALDGSGVLAMGQLAKAVGNNDVAIGTQTKVIGNNSTAIGSTAQAIGNSSAAYGTQAVANGLGATAVGPGASAGTGDTAATAAAGATAVGRASQATKEGASALGWAANASVENAAAIGRDTTANIAGGVALGYQSVTTTAAGVQGYNPADSRINKYSTQSGAVGTSTLAAVSVGNGTTATRQITGLAAGTADTDAVNVAQLKNVNLKYAADTGNSDVLLKDGTLTVKGDGDLISTDVQTNGAIKISAKVGGAITANNDGKAVAPTTNGIATTTNVTDAINNSGWKVTSSNNGGTVTGTTTEKVSPGDTVTLRAGKNIVLDQAGKQFTYSLDKTVDLTNAGSLTVGGTKVNNDGITIKAPTTPGTTTTDVTLTNAGLNNGGNKITNVAEGKADTDAVNVKQLKDAKTILKDGKNTTVVGTGTAADPYKVNVEGALTGITSIANTATGPKMTFGGNSINITGGSLDMGNNKITSLATGTADTDAVNVKQLKDTELHITPGTYTPDANKKVKLTYTDGNNTVVTGKEAVIDLSSLATGGTTSTEKVQKAADATGDKNIAEVGPKSGDTFGAANATYEVSVSRNAVKDAAREAVTVNNGGNTDNPISVTSTPDNTNHNTTYAVTFDGNKAAKQIPLTYKANGTGDKTVKLDKGLDFTNGTNTTSEIGNDGVVKFNLNKDVDLSNTGSLTVGGTKVNNGGVTITAPAGGTTTDVKLTNTGLDNGGNKIVNVKDGDVNATSKDAVNGSQLYTVDQKFNNKINLGADGNTETTKLALDNASGIKFNIKGDGSGASGANQYISTTASGSDIKVDLTQDAKDKLNKTYNVTSTDNSVKVTTTSANGVTTFDLKVAPATGTTSTWDIKSSADTANGGATATGHETNAKTIANTNSVEMIAGKNLTVKQTSDTNGAKVEFALSDKIAVGKDGVNGIDGKIGVNGKDGASVVINGKDGSIGLTGPRGATGAPGASATLKVKDGVPGVDGAPGTNLTRIVYTDKNNVDHEVATHDDGMKFAGDDGQANQATNANVIKKHLNNVVDIIGGATKADLTTNNIGVNNDGNGKLLVQLSKNLNGINTIKNGGTTITLNNAPGGAANTPAVTISGGNLSVGGNKVTNVDDGTNDSDAVNLKQLKAAKTEVKAGDNVTVKLTTDTTDGHNIYTVNAVTPAVYTKADGTKVYKIVDPTSGAVTWNTSPDGTGTVVNAGDVITSFETPANGTTKGSTTGGTMIVNNVGSAINGKTGATYLDKLDAAVGDNNTKHAAVNVTDLKNTADALTDKGLKFDANVGGVKTNKLGSVVKVQGAGASADADYSGANIKTFINQTGDDTTIDVKLDKNLAGINSITGDTNSGKLVFQNPTATGNNGDAFKFTGGNINAGNNNITNLKSGIVNNNDTDNKNGANIGDVKKIAKDTDLHIAPTAGTTNNVAEYTVDANNKVTLTYQDGNGAAVAAPKAVIDLSALANKITSGYTFNANATANGGTVANDTTHPAAVTAVANGGTINYAAGKNLTVKQDIDATNKTHTYTYSLDKDLTNLDKVVVNGKDGVAGKDGVTIVGPQGATGATGIPGTNGIDGKVGIAGKDGKDAVSISGKDGVGHIGLQGPKGTPGTPGADGANLDITTDHGTQTLVKPEANNNNQSERIVYVPKDANGNPLKDTDGNTIKREVATMDDGLKFAGDDGQANQATNTNVIKKHLNNVVDIIGGATKADLTTNNIGVNNDGNGKLLVQLSKNLKGLNSIQLGDNTIKSNGDNIEFTTKGGTTKTVATTDQLWTIQANGTDVPATNGKVNVVGKDGITVAKNAAGNLEISGAGLGTMNSFDVTANNGATSKTIDNGKKVDFNATSNLTVKQTSDANGTHIEYALNKDVDLGTNGSLKIGDTTINNGGLTIANGPSITNTGVDAGDKKITNVADGAVNATSKDAVNGSQLKKYTDAAKTTVEAGDNNVKVETDTTAADGHTNYKVSLEPVVTIGDTHKVKIDGHTGDITGLTNVTLNDPTFATKGRAATEEQLKQVLTEAKNKAIEKVQAGTAAAGDTNIATVAPKAGDTFGAAGATYEVSVSKNAVKDAAKEAVKVTSVSPAITVTPDTSVAHETTYKVGFDGNQAATQIPLTYKQNGGSARTVKLSDGLNFIDGTNTKARTAADGKVTFDVMGDLTGITSISNTSGGPKMTFGGSSINVTGGDLNMGGNNKIVNLAPGKNATDAATVGQLTKINSTSTVIAKNVGTAAAPVYELTALAGGTVDNTEVNMRIDQLGEEVGRVGAQGAALSALKPIQYDPLEPTQIMAGYGNYRGTSAIAMGVAHYKNESTLIHGGISWAGGSSHMMANAGVTWKVGNRDSEAAVADRYRKGPISSAYAMQQEMAAMKAQNAGLKGEVSDLKAENEQMKAQIAAMMAKLGL